MSFSNLLTGSPLLWRIARGQHSDPGGFICVGDRNWKLSPVLKFQNKNDKIAMVSKFDWSTIISYFFLWTAEHDVLTKHKIKRNTEVVVLSPILSLKAEQQRKVINLFLLFSPSSPPIFSYSIPHVTRRQQYWLQRNWQLRYRCRRFWYLTFRISIKVEAFHQNLWVYSTWREGNTSYQIR